MIKVISEIISSGKFPFELKDDLIRWSLHQGVKELGAMESCTSALPFLEIGVLITQWKMDVDRFAELFTKLDKVVLALSTSSFQEMRARRLVSAIEELILSLPPSRDRGWALSKLRRSWGHLLITPTSKDPNETVKANGK